MENIKSPCTTQVRLFFVSNDLQLNVNKSEILTSISTDHSAITLEIKPCGPSHWKFNSSFTDDHDYVKLIKKKYLYGKVNIILRIHKNISSFLFVYSL